MSLPLPASLSPSKVSAFKSCPLAFRYSVIEQRPELPSLPAFRGTLVHKALELLFLNFDTGRRTRPAATDCLDEALASLAPSDRYTELGLTVAEKDQLRKDAEKLLSGYFRLEDPNAVNAVGIELMLEAEADDVLVRGIIDRLDLTDEGQFVVCDYKTGRSPRPNRERSSLIGVHLYSWLLEQVVGIRPTELRLLYLAEGVVVRTQPSDLSVSGARRSALAVWRALETACRCEDFRPSPSALCRSCSFQALCPVYGPLPSPTATTSSSRS